MFFSPAKNSHRFSTSCIEIENRQRFVRKKYDIFAKISVLSNSEQKKRDFIEKRRAFFLLYRPMSPPQHPPIVYVMFLRPRAKSSDKSIPFRTTKAPSVVFFTPLFYSFIFRSPMIWRCDVYLFSEIFASGFVVVEKSAFFIFIKFYFVYETRGKKQPYERYEDML